MTKKIKQVLVSSLFLFQSLTPECIIKIYAAITIAAIADLNFQHYLFYKGLTFYRALTKCLRVIFAVFQFYFLLQGGTCHDF